MELKPRSEEDFIMAKGGEYQNLMDLMREMASA
jgi:hypothetical protein